MRQFRVRGAAAVATAWIAVVACSVFPDRAVLPSEMGGASGDSSSGALGGMLPAAGSAGNASGNDAGRSGDTESGAGEGGESALGGAPGNSQSGTGSGGLGLAGGSGSTAQAGAAAAGVAGGGGCAASHVVVTPGADAWIDAGDPQANHGSEPELVVLAGASERRALLLFNVPATKVGQAFVGAELVLTLSAAPALGTSARNLSVHLLTQTFSETRVSWKNYSNGAAHAWTAPGGDFVAGFASGTLRAGDAALRVDVSAAIAARTSTEVGFLVRDAAGTTLPALSFNFASREEGGARSPVLDLEYCAK